MEISEVFLLYEEDIGNIIALMDSIAYEINCNRNYNDSNNSNYNNSNYNNKISCASDIIAYRINCTGFVRCKRMVKPSRVWCKYCHCVYRIIIPLTILKVIDPIAARFYWYDVERTGKLWKMKIQELTNIQWGRFYYFNGITYQHSLNINDSRCARVPYLKDIYNGKCERFHPFCDNLRVNKLGCIKHYCNQCWMNFIRGFYYVCVLSPRLPKQLLKMIFRYSICQRVRIGHRICFYSELTAQLIRSSIYYSSCPWNLKICPGNTSYCLKFIPLRLEICMVCQNVPFLEI